MTINKIINDYITYSYIYFLNIINYYIKHIYIYYTNFFKNKNNIKSVHNEIYLYLNDITNKWNSNNINNIDLICDIVYIYNKYNNSNKQTNITNESYIQDQDIKYYTLGWYMYQNILFKHQTSNFNETSQSS